MKPPEIDPERDFENYLALLRQIATASLTVALLDLRALPETKRRN